MGSVLAAMGRGNEGAVAAGAGDLPGEVRDIAVSERYIWVGTEGGLVRLQREAVLP